MHIHVHTIIYVFVLNLNLTAHDFLIQKLKSPETLHFKSRQKNLHGIFKTFQLFSG